MTLAIGDLVPAGFLTPDATRHPLDPQAKARLLAEMPFVSEPFGDDISDLADKTPSGSGRNTRRMLIGGAVGVGLAVALVRLVPGLGRKISGSR